MCPYASNGNSACRNNPLFTVDTAFLQSAVAGFSVPASLKDVENQVLADADVIPDLAGVKLEEVREARVYEEVMQSGPDGVPEGTEEDLGTLLGLIRTQCDLMKSVTYYCTERSSARACYRNVTSAYKALLEDVPNIQGTPILTGQNLKFHTLAGHVPRRYKGRRIEPLRRRKKQKAASNHALPSDGPDVKTDNLEEVAADTSFDLSPAVEEDVVQEMAAGSSAARRLKVLLCSKGEPNVMSYCTAGAVSRKVPFGQGYIVDEEPPARAAGSQGRSYHGNC